MRHDDAKIPDSWEKSFDPENPGHWHPKYKVRLVDGVRQGCPGCLEKWDLPENNGLKIRYKNSKGFRKEQELIHNDPMKVVAVRTSQNLVDPKKQLTVEQEAKERGVSESTIYRERRERVNPTPEMIRRAETETLRFTLLVKDGKSPEEAAKICGLDEPTLNLLWEQFKRASGAFSAANIEFFRSVARGEVIAPTEMLRIAQLALHHILMDPEIKAPLKARVATDIVTLYNKPGLTPTEAAEADENSIELAKRILGKDLVKVGNESKTEN